MADDWRPYYYGRWVWVPLTGWTWVPYEPWGWVAFHYGRWHWAVGIGWYWIPHYAWGPAWVSWWWDMDYFCWAPLGWYGYPVVVINNVFYDRYTGAYPIHSRALVAVRKDQAPGPRHLPGCPEAGKPESGQPGQENYHDQQDSPLPSGRLQVNGGET